MINHAPSHIVDDLQLTNVKVQPFPPNAISKVQPMDAGIFAAFKRRYRRYQEEEEGNERAAAEKAVTDRFTKSEKITI